ncbi:hypothetical protein TRV_03877, partial [Trichophyton verrucosum HKI 0517]
DLQKKEREKKKEERKITKESREQEPVTKEGQLRYIYLEKHLAGGQYNKIDCNTDYMQL